MKTKKKSILHKSSFVEQKAMPRVAVRLTRFGEEQAATISNGNISNCV